jgi:hypothetical protein
MRLLIAIEILLPCSECSVLWLPWPPDLEVPERDPGDYNHIHVGRAVLMPRRTRNYGIQYTFSGQAHPVEESTPPTLQALMEVTNRWFGLDGRAALNSILVNDYDCGRESIGEHSDAEAQFEGRDVYCWVSGPAARPGVFRVRKVAKAVPEELHRYCGDPDDAWNTRTLMSVDIPQGLYVMRGDWFQRRYSHEFPELCVSLVRRLIAKAPDLWPSFPVDVPRTEQGAPRKTLVQARWLKENAELVVEALLSGRLASSKAAAAQEAREFRRWCLERTSFTMRSFKREQ